MTIATAPPDEPWTVAVPGLAHPVCLIRHAPTSWTGRRLCGRADPPLSVEGRSLAADLAMRVVSSADLTREVVIRSSPARRALATARAISKASGWPIVEDEDLLEVDAGVAEGLTFDELAARHRGLAADWTAGKRVDWPDGETAEQVDRRAARAAGHLLVEADRGPVVIVSHGALLSALIAAVSASVPPFFVPGGIVWLRPGDAR